MKYPILPKKNTTFVLLIFILACSTQVDDSKKIEFNKMKVAVWNLMNADNLYQQQIFRDTALKQLQLTKSYYKRIFNDLNISETAFVDTYKYYQKHPNELKVLLDSVEIYGRQQKEDKKKLQVQ